MRSIPLVAAAMALAGSGLARAAAADVVTQAYDARRSGVTFGETILTPDNVNTQTFGKLGSWVVDGRVYAQPLYLQGIDIPDAGTRNVVYVATAHDSLYAFDADSLDPTPLFQVSFGTSVPSGVIGCSNTLVEVGITATPAIDRSSGVLYVEVRSQDSHGTQSHTLHAVDVRDGLDVMSPVTISADVQVAGNPDVVFDPKMHNSRPGLLLANGNVYLAFSSLCDYGPYHGWLFSYSAATLQQQNVFVTTPTGQQGGIWQGGGGLVADSQGNIYASIGNGSMDLLDGGQDIAMAMARWSPDLQLVDWFSPYNEASLSKGDLDLGPCPTMLLEDQNLLIGSGKGADVYVAHSDGFGHQHVADNQQLFQDIITPMPIRYGWSGMATFPGPSGPQLFVWGAGMPLTSYQLDATQFSPVATSAIVAPSDKEGAPMSISTSGVDAGPGVLWVLMASTNGNGDVDTATAGVMRAFSTADVTTELWDSDIRSQDSLGLVSKFTPPTVANGRVFAGTFAGLVDVYGLLTDGGAVEDAGADAGEEDAGDAGGNAGPDAGPDGGDAGQVPDDGSATTTGGSSSGSSSSGTTTGLSSVSGGSCSTGSAAAWWLAIPLAIFFLSRRRGS